MLCANTLEDPHWLAGFVAKVPRLSVARGTVFCANALRDRHRSRACFALTSALISVKESMFCANASTSQPNYKRVLR